MVAENEGKTMMVFTDEDHKFLEILKRKQRAAYDVTENASTLSSSKGNIASFVYSAKGARDTNALASISTASSPEWIVDSYASRHVTDATSEFSSYTHLAIPKSIQLLMGQLNLWLVIFQEKEARLKFGTDTWHSGLCYLDREGMDLALTFMIENVGAGGSQRSVKDVLLLHHRFSGDQPLNFPYCGHHGWSFLSPELPT